MAHLLHSTNNKEENIKVGGVSTNMGTESMISTQYPCFVLTPTFMFSSLLFVGCSKRAVVFDSTVIQASLYYIGNSGWANASSLDWIFFFKSWCIELPARTSFLYIFMSIFPYLLLLSLLQLYVLDYVITLVALGTYMVWIFVTN